MKHVFLILAAVISSTAFAESNNGLTHGGDSSYDNYTPPSYNEGSSSVPAPISVPANVLKTCVSADNVHYYVTRTNIQILDGNTGRFLGNVAVAEQSDQTLVCADASYRVYPSANIMLINNAIVVYCR